LLCMVMVNDGGNKKRRRNDVSARRADGPACLRMSRSELDEPVEPGFR
jgi:hypothetical protein